MWVPHVYQVSSISIILILSTIQKIPAVYLLSVCSYCFSSTITSCILIRILVGRLSPLKRYNIKKILAYSSVVHMRWIRLMCLVSIYNWVSYISLYVITLIIALLSIININSLLVIQ